MCADRVWLVVRELKQKRKQRERERRKNDKTKAQCFLFCHSIIHFKPQNSSSVQVGVLTSALQHHSIYLTRDSRHRMLQWIKAVAPHYRRTKSRNSPCFSLRHLSSFLYRCESLSFYLLSLACPTVINDKFSQMTTSSFFFFTLMHKKLQAKIPTKPFLFMMLSLVTEISM